MRSWQLGVAGLISVAPLLAGCGDSGGGGGSCGNVSPCGGDLIGTWTITSSCEGVGNFIFIAPCPAATLNESQITTSGTIVFDADMTFTISSSVSGTRRFNVPLDCSPADTCDAYASLISPGPPDATTTCTTAGGSCDCTMAYSAPMTNAQSGTYSTAGNTVTSVPASGPPDTAGYCVQGNTLHLIANNSLGDFESGVIATK